MQSIIAFALKERKTSSDRLENRRKIQCSLLLTFALLFQSICMAAIREIDQRIKTKNKQKPTTTKRLKDISCHPHPKFTSEGTKLTGNKITLHFSTKGKLKWINTEFQDKFLKSIFSSTKQTFLRKYDVYYYKASHGILNLQKFPSAILIFIKKKKISTMIWG